jgi:hypothetical protein
MVVRDRGGWRARYGEEGTCVRCRGSYDLMALDRLLWCDRCRARARDRAAWWGWAGGLLFGAGVALYVWLAIRPSDLVRGGWVATVVAAVWIGSKIGREIVYGAMRWSNAAGVEEEPEGSAPRE